MASRTRTVRRSVALPEGLVKEAARLAPKELRENLNRLVIVSLEQYVKRMQEEAFDKAMAAMAADPAIRAASADIASEFLPADLDGLQRD